MSMNEYFLSPPHYTVWQLTVCLNIQVKRLKAKVLCKLTKPQPIRTHLMFSKQQTKCSFSVWLADLSLDALSHLTWLEHGIKMSVF